MIRIRIGSDERKLAEASESWIQEQVGRRRNFGETICVQVVVQARDVDMVLSTPGCGGGGAGRVPSPKERVFLELWSNMHLDTDNFSTGSLVVFLKRLQSET